MPSVLVVDDHPMIMQGCRVSLSTAGIDSIVEAASPTAGYRTFLRSKPDLSIVDLNFTGNELGGLALIERMRRGNKHARILVFTMHNDPGIVARALEIGANGYLLKDSPSSELIVAARRLLRGEVYLAHSLAVQVAMRRFESLNRAAQGLSARESQVISLISRGDGYEQIATKLGVSYKTVANIASGIRVKFKLGSFAELVRFSIEHALRAGGE
jgi:DNA-binding NarL/FixJ family response regulator